MVQLPPGRFFPERPPGCRADRINFVVFVSCHRALHNPHDGGPFTHGPAHQSVDFVPFTQQEFGKVRPILAGDAGDEGFLCHGESFRTSYKIRDNFKILEHRGLGTRINVAPERLTAIVFFDWTGSVFDMRGTRRANACRVLSQTSTCSNTIWNLRKGGLRKRKTANQFRKKKIRWCLNKSLELCHQ